MGLDGFALLHETLQNILPLWMAERWHFASELFSQGSRQF